MGKRDLLEKCLDYIVDDFDDYEELKKYPDSLALVHELQEAIASMHADE